VELVRQEHTFHERANRFAEAVLPLLLRQDGKGRALVSLASE